MKLLNNNLFIILIVILVVAGLLAMMQLMTPKNSLEQKDYGSDNAQYNNIRSEIDQMKSWDKTTFYRINNTIQDYKKTDQIDAEMETELKELLENKYLLQLAAAVKSFCASSSSMGKWQELNSEAKKFAENKDFGNSIQMLANYYNMRTVAQSAVKYGKNEQYNSQKSANFEAVLNSFPSKVNIKNNPTIKQEVDQGLQALGLVQGLDRRYQNTDLETCDCASRFGQNKYYLDSCLEAQK
jgi:hypothetical protein